MKKGSILYHIMRKATIYAHIVYHSLINYLSFSGPKCAGSPGWPSGRPGEGATNAMMEGKAKEENDEVLMNSKMFLKIQKCTKKEENQSRCVTSTSTFCCARWISPLECVTQLHMSVNLHSMGWFPQTETNPSSGLK